ncbi:hypothetical protein NCCP2716_18560 [Sporosarcina sp. NCCP-2716]|uniref:putative bifunctional diguanylate cyclase/phosphodiesterase n=1 Tax=Sporosarcina sp. NCCP-2716 TaxID=2943679 RepID=UPI00203EFB0A|nr:GGDEF and EAL domain-containing protein [Sporosarcina sp. NCCP-2716]GKV69358.1 hypothetical protein NCCP2716_18560 [Sporosarcina sp. NCCP-2716]
MDRSHEELTEFVKKIQQQQQLFFEQAKQLNLSKESVEGVLLELCRNAAQIMKAERVSIWLFNEDHTRMTEEITYTEDSIGVPAVREITKEEAGEYFKSITGQRVRSVSDVASDEALGTLPDDYFADYPMASLIEASIILSRGIGGMLCCETVARRNWSLLDEVIMAAIADMLSFVFDRLFRLEMESRVRELAYTDAVTGIDNENAFIEKVNFRLRHAGRAMHGGFLYLKIDQFSAIQSVLGPEASRVILSEIARRFKQAFPADSVIARIAFDHFIVFTEHEGDPVKNRRDMETILAYMRKPIQYGGQDVYLTASYGVALYPDHIKTAYEGIQAAKTALDSSQPPSPRKTRAIYDPSMSEKWQEAMQSEMNLESAMERNEFCLYYQPQVESVSHVMTGAEALIRWNHPEKGILSPGTFIGIAETTGLIMQIGEWAICQACVQLKEWEQMGLEQLTISVNVSPRHFLYPKFPDFLKDCKDKHQIDPSRLIIEITENVAVEDEEVVEAHIRLLQDMGFSVSIDDFGTGYSAFIYLQKFSFQEVKIDRQFVRGIDTDVRSRAIVRSILALAKSLHMHTVAEGVETESQLRRLEALGCFEIQGFYFSKPVPIEELNGWLLSSPRFPNLQLPLEAT